MSERSFESTSQRNFGRRQGLVQDHDRKRQEKEKSDWRRGGRDRLLGRSRPSLVSDPDLRKTDFDRPTLRNQPPKLEQIRKVSGKLVAVLRPLASEKFFRPSFILKMADQKARRKSNGSANPSNAGKYGRDSYDRGSGY